METYANLPVVSSIFRASGGLAVPVPASNDEARRAKQQQQKKRDVKVAPAELSEVPAASEKPSTLAVRKAIAAHKQAFNPAVAANAVPLCILPEGTTHSGRTLLKFFSGAFEGGGPVQPVLLSYPYTYFHAACFGGGMAEHVLRLLINPWQRVEVTYMPVYHPSAEEQTDADLYAENVRLAMCASAGVPPSAYGAKALRKEYLAAAVGLAAPADKNNA
jgi:1-acyl-sn-glycerol-3-phosphate acyltransferase